MKARQALEEVVQGVGGDAKIMYMTAKCSDLFNAQFFDAAGNSVGEYEGYVPGFMPGEHYGDYVELQIDLKTGQILNWRPPKLSEIRQLLAKKSEGS